MDGFIYLLDTNIIADLIRNPAGRVAQQIAAKGENVVCTSIVVACELRFGARKKGSRLLATRVEDILAVIEVLALDTGVFIAITRRFVQYWKRVAPPEKSVLNGYADRLEPGTQRLMPAVVTGRCSPCQTLPRFVSNYPCVMRRDRA
ncbi:MAG: PIN domain-containing protein [Desulfurivibrio sp.]|nr:PIN domain-containing protein [Desulfurivibrio sp.]